MSDTPLTDAEVKKVVGLPQPVDFDLMATHARRLEKALKVAEEALRYFTEDDSVKPPQSSAEAWAQYYYHSQALSTIAILKEEA